MKLLRFAYGALACAACSLAGGEELTVARTEASSVAPPLPARALEGQDELAIGLALAARERKDARDSQDALDCLRRLNGGDEAAARAWAALDAKLRVQALARALDAGAEPLRRRAVKELAAFDSGTGADEAREALGRAVVRENVDEIREAARKAWLERLDANRPKAIAQMAEGLDIRNLIEKRRAFEALRLAGGDDVLEAVITKITRRWGSGPRNHIMIAQQRSYIADYDVSGAVFDPVIRTFITGVVLDSKILGIEITEWILSGLRRLRADEAIQNDPKLWEDFVKRKRAEK